MSLNTNTFLLAIFLGSAVVSPAMAADVPASEKAPVESDDGQGPGGWSGFVAGGVGASTEFPGSKDYEMIPLMRARLAYDDYYIEVVGPSAKVNVAPGEFFQAGPMIAYDGGRDDSVTNEIIRLLPQIDSSVELGGFASLNFENVLSPSDGLSLEATFLQAIEGHEGYVATVGLSYSYAFTRQFSASLSSELSFADEKYMDTYFSVDAAGSAISGLTQFDASSGLSTAEVSVSGRYMFNKSREVVGRVAYERLLGDAADSPIVKEQGSADQFSGGLGIVFSF